MASLTRLSSLIDIFISLMSFFAFSRNRPLFSWEDAKLIFTAISVLFVTKAHLGEARTIASLSMSPTYNVGDRVLTEWLSYLFRPPKVGDVVFFKFPKPLHSYLFGEGGSEGVIVKRVVAAAGDRVQIRTGRLLVNGIARDGDFVSETDVYDMDSERVPVGCVFVLGDNRDNSCDSRHWGFLPIDYVISRALLTYWQPQMKRG